MMRIEKLISWFALFSGLSISMVAIYYSVSGLVSIFSAATISIIVMGTSLEIGKLVATVWLKRFWNIVPLIIKVYLITAIIVLMMITSMGTFGFISKSHSDQSISSNTIMDQLEILDSKITDQQHNLEMAKKSLEQLDATVDETMHRTTTDKGAIKSLKILQSQKADREILNHNIDEYQKVIQTLKEQRFPLSQQLRKSEAEFGPIKYIAAVLYEHSDDKGKLEEAVRFIIILIVVVFDPLAITLLLASQYSFKWIEENSNIQSVPINDIVEPYSENDKIDSEEYIEDSFLDTEEDIVETESENDKYLSEKDAKTKWKSENKDDTIKRQEKFHSLGLTDKLPWDN